MLKKAKPSGLLNSADAQRDMYNHGLAAFVLGQAYGMTGDPQIGRVLDKSLRLISNTQCEDGGWDYRAKRQQHGHDLSLVVMQAKALRSAVDSGFEVRNDVVRLAIQSVRDHYKAENGARGFDEKAQEGPGQFTYDGNRTTLAMAACGVVCLQEFGQYDDWRIAKNMEQISKEVSRIRPNRGSGEVRLMLIRSTMSARPFIRQVEPTGRRIILHFEIISSLPRSSVRRIPVKTAVGEIPAGCMESRVNSTGQPSLVLFWQCPIDICRFSRKGRSKA